MKLKFRWRIIVSIFTLITMIYAVKTKQTHGHFVGVPFDFRFPTLGRIKERWWNPDDPRVLTPHVFGVGWSINIPQLLNRLGLRKEQQED